MGLVEKEMSKIGAKDENLDNDDEDEDMMADANTGKYCECGGSVD